MKVGSIVQCVNASNWSEFFFNYLKRPKLNGAYTIRAIKPDGGILLEEIINPIHSQSGTEYGFFPWRFNELQPPLDIQEALDSCIPVLIER